MEAALDEVSVVPCDTKSPGDRIATLANAVAELARFGVPKVLRSVRDAFERDIGDGRSLKSWLFDRTTSPDARRLVASWATSGPYLDDAGGKFALLEGDRAIEPTIDGESAVGGGYIALAGGVLVRLDHARRASSTTLHVHLDVVEGDEFRTDVVEVVAVATSPEVQSIGNSLQIQLLESVQSGGTLLDRLSDLFPRIVVEEDAKKQIRALSSAIEINQLKRHLRALNDAALAWRPGAECRPEGICWSPESNATLNHSQFGPMRDFATPDGFSDERWSLHTKLTGVGPERMYFKHACVQPSDAAKQCVSTVAIGYVGPHLPTVKFR